ncbi:MAG: cobalamin B12-binding domain-containing protein, partial [Acidobacteria bacterium]|nr:cobalamin B12-binding domain-containing protein [Acidobacteriota bacterium]
MDVLLLRPTPLNERFGAAPFFRTEPLGLEYVAAALEARGHRASVVDLRFGGSVERWLSRLRPPVVGISCMHSVEIDETLELVRSVRRAAPGVFLLLGGHSAAAFPAPLKCPEVNAISVGDGERVAPDLVDVLSRGGSPRDVAGLLVNAGNNDFVATPEAEPVSLDDVPLPARHALATGHRRYSCLQFRPVWVVET